MSIFSQPMVVNNVVMKINWIRKLFWRIFSMVKFLLRICRNFYAVRSHMLIVFWKLSLTFGGMWRCRRVAVARVFALVVRYRVMLLFVYSRVGKNRDTRRGSPARAGAACTAIEGLAYWPQYCRGAEANCIYRPVTVRFLFLFQSSRAFYKLAQRADWRYLQ